jgi:hypothetical protein
MYSIGAPTNPHIKNAPPKTPRIPSRFSNIRDRAYRRLCNITDINGDIADIPVIVKYLFNKPFSFLENIKRSIPSIRNIRPNIPANMNSLDLNESENGIKKKESIKKNITMEE